MRSNDASKCDGQAPPDNLREIIGNVPKARAETDATGTDLFLRQVEHKTSSSQRILIATKSLDDDMSGVVDGVLEAGESLVGGV